jgi:hypothetical protein
LTARVGADHGYGAIEVGGFGGWGEDIGEEEVGHATLCFMSASAHTEQVY